MYEDGQYKCILQSQMDNKYTSLITSIVSNLLVL